MTSLPLKWAGNKQWLVKLIAPLIEREIDVSDGLLVEPFAGACGFFLSSGFQKAHLNDNNTALIHFFRTLKQSYEIFDLDKWPVSESHYYQVRDRYNHQMKEHQFDNWLANALVYLNVYGFNGLYRTSAATGFNVPYGKVQSLPESKMENIAAAHSRLGGVKFTTGCFRSLDIDSNASLVYADPPYAKTFTKYTDDFTQEDQLELVQKLSKVQCPVIASNSIKDPIVLTAYRDNGFKLYKVQVRRMISGDIKNRSKEFELIAFKNWSTRRIRQVCGSDKISAI